MMQHILQGGFYSVVLSALAAGQEGDPAALSKLHDIVVPPPVSWWPPAPGWYGLAGLLIGLATWLAWRGVSRRRAGAFRRAALRELDGLRSRMKIPAQRMEALRQLPCLLKRTALAAWPREEVAGLSGKEWLAFLDRSSGMNDFTEGGGRILLDLAYGRSSSLEILTDEEIRALTGLAGRWIENCRVPEPG